MLRYLMASTLVLCGSPMAGQAWAKPPAVGEAAPPFVIYLADRTKVSSAELRGKVVLINYWATWCGPCKAEIPALDSYNLTFRDRGFAVFGVLTRDSVPPTQLKAFARTLSYPLARGISDPYTTIGDAVPTS